jgi:YbgC/YbaW family acyl-CoA thioester hydrolase
MAEPFRTTRRVDFVDTDTAQIVHFSNFFRFMESAELDFLHSLGLSVSMETEEGKWIGFPRVSASCDYFRPAKFLDVMDISVRVENIGAKSVSYQFEFFKDGVLLARGQITAVCCRTLPDNRLESMEIPANIRQKLQETMSS